MQILISPEGTVRCLYSDDLTDLLAEGRSEVRRASRVEPAPEGGWTADLSPVNGPKLGPYALRSEALAAEVAWIEAHDVPVPNR